jgi:hypothetical protein
MKKYGGVEASALDMQLKGQIHVPVPSSLGRIFYKE